MQKNTICLWYNNDAVEAAHFYSNTFPGSSVGRRFPFKLLQMTRPRLTFIGMPLSTTEAQLVSVAGAKTNGDFRGKSLPVF